MTALHAYFADAAARELNTREKNYPAMIEAGTIARDDAEADLSAWRDIANLFRDGSAETETSWAQLELATSRALQRCEEYLAEKPDNATRRARRDAVWGMHERISWHRRTFVANDRQTTSAPLPAAEKEDWYTGGMREAERQLSEWKKSLDEAA